MKHTSFLKTIRQRAGVTQEQLARQLKISREWISYFETDKIRPNQQTKKQIARILKVSEKVLFDE